MQALIDFFECRSIEYPSSDFPKVEICARVILPKGRILTIFQDQIAEAVKAACENNIELDRGQEARSETRK